MKLTAEDKQKILDATLKFLAASPGQSRNEVIKGTLLHCGFPPQKAAAAPSQASRINYIRSYIGTVLTDLAAKGSIAIDKNGRYALQKEELIIVKEAECRAEIFRVLKTKSIKKAALYALLQKKFGTDKTASQKDDNTLKQLAGQILAEERAKGTLFEENGLYAITPFQTAIAYPKTPLPEEAFEPLFLARIHAGGGKFFEQFVANLLEKYYLMNGRNVLTCEVVGGSSDGGVDIMLETEEELGFIEKVIIQTKNRKSIPVTEKEIREFYGVMNAQKGTRGIFVTTSTFHPGANTLLTSLDNCVGIDGKKLFSLAKKTGYGIHVTKNGLSFDDAMFSY